MSDYGLCDLEQQRDDLVEQLAEARAQLAEARAEVERAKTIIHDLYQVRDRDTGEACWCDGVGPARLAPGYEHNWRCVQAREFAGNVYDWVGEKVETAGDDE